MGTLPIQERGPNVRVIANTSTWIEGEALRQLDETARLPGMVRAVGLPDLHPGKGSPIGAAFLSRDIVRPALVGADVGCGMALWQTDLPVRKARPERLAERLDGLDRPWDGDTTAWLAERGLTPTGHEIGLGTVGSGNHFAELQAVVEVRDPATFAAIGLDADRLMLLVHSGSRGLGEAIWWTHAETNGIAGLDAESEDGRAWLARHDLGVRWAAANRDLVAHRFAGAIGADAERRLDVCHNDVTAAIVDGCRCWLHRKGAAPADSGPVVIPGSRGDVSVLVSPTEGRDEALFSLAHGAGRKMTRSEARGKLRGRYRKDDLTRNRWGGRVVCGNEHALWEEAPDAYKDVSRVVGDLEEAGLLRVVAVLRPVVTFKSSEVRSEPDDRRARMRARDGARDAKARGWRP